MTAEKPKKITPMLRQYLDVKDKHRDKLLLFRMGDFYEIFFDDAEIAARTLKITLTSRNKNEDDAIPMCGFPHHAADGYIAGLVQAGHKVVVCDQVEDPKQAKGLVRREVTRIITPGINPDDEPASAAEHNFLAAICWPEKGRPDLFGLALLDIGTGKFKITEVAGNNELFEEIGRHQPAEIILPPPLQSLEKSTREEIGRQFETCHLTMRPQRESFASQAGHNKLSRLLGTINLDGFGGRHLSVGAGAAGAIIDYVKETNSSLEHIESLQIYRNDSFLPVDRSLIYNLELLQTMQDRQRQGSLLGVLDRCRTSMGSRLLKEWLLFPLLVREAIEERLDAVEILVREKRCRLKLRDRLDRVYDLERLAARLAAGRAGARDLLSLRNTLSLVPSIRNLISDLPLQAGLLHQAQNGLNDLESLRRRIDEELSDDAPLAVNEGGLIKDGVNPELDELRHIRRNARQWLLEFENSEKEKTGISGLKVRYNRVFGYYIEVTKRNLDLVPEAYQRRQTLTNADRFITPELKAAEEKILGAEDKINQLEYELFLKLRQAAAAELPALRETARCLTLLDVLGNLAEVADSGHYCRPEIVKDKQVLEIEDGRHPVLENLADGFIANDSRLQGDREQLWIITGPNMAGKSTFLRQNGLFALLAQMGSFIPARKARLSIFDRILTRVGASDNLSRGLSTFMVEMTETARIMHQATADSLIIMDEIGRGTSTFDGLSLAWALAEEIHDRLGSLTLFATHYHELTELELIKPRIRNYNVAVQQEKGEISFIRRIVAGATNHSYGIEVAKLAGIPGPVIGRAREILGNLEQAEIAPGGNLRLTGKTVLGSRGLPAGRHGNQPQNSGYLPFLEPAPPTAEADQPYRELVENLRGIDLNRTTPLKALNLLDKLQKMANKG